MNHKVLKKGDFEAWINGLKKTYEVTGPQRKGDGTIFAPLEKTPELSYTTTILPPKKIFFPQEEALYEYRRKNGEWEITDLMTGKLEKKRILLGVHSCDLSALLILDKIFMDEFKDPYFIQRRKNTVVVAALCEEPDEYCFCDAAGTGPIPQDGYDLLMIDLGDKIYFQPGTEVGEKLVQNDLFKDATQKEVEEKEKKIEELKRKVNSGFKFDNLSDQMKEKFEDELWKEYAEKCVLCGACNFVCPTCHCFTIKDDTNLRGTEGKRIRRWDSCHFKNFALIAGGLNFRGERNSRVKNRLYDKLCYSPQKYGVYSCVGCGRCIRSCPAKIDIREIAKKIRGGAE